MALLFRDFDKRIEIRSTRDGLIRYYRYAEAVRFLEEHRDEPGLTDALRQALTEHFPIEFDSLSDEKVTEEVTQRLLDGSLMLMERFEPRAEVSKTVKSTFVEAADELIEVQPAPAEVSEAAPEPVLDLQADTEAEPQPDLAAGIDTEEPPEMSAQAEVEEPPALATGAEVAQPPEPEVGAKIEEPPMLATDADVVGPPTPEVDAKTVKPPALATQAEAKGPPAPAVAAQTAEPPELATKAKVKKPPGLSTSAGVQNPAVPDVEAQIGGQDSDPSESDDKKKDPKATS